MTPTPRWFASLAAGFAGLLLAATAVASDVDAKALKAAVDNPARAPEQRVRDISRHPRQTLEFFGIAPDMTVVEIWPGLTLSLIHI